MKIAVSTRILDEVRDMLASSLDIESEALLLNAKLEYAYGLDSNELIHFAQQIEQRFGLSVSQIEREDWVTANDILRFVEKKMRDNPGSGG